MDYKLFNPFSLPLSVQYGDICIVSNDLVRVRKTKTKQKEKEKENIIRSTKKKKKSSAMARHD